MLEKFVHTIFAFSLLVNAIAYIPQLVQLYKSKDGKALSLTMFALFNLGQVFSIWHAFYTKDWIFMAGTFGCLLPCSAITGLLIFYKLHKKKH